MRGPASRRRVCVAAVGLVSLAFAAGPVVRTAAAAAPLSGAFTSIPPAVVTPGARVELRLGLTNPTSMRSIASVRFLVDGRAVGSVQRIPVAAKAQALATAWVSAPTTRGRHTTGYQLAAGRTLTGSRPLDVLGTPGGAPRTFTSAWLEPGDAMTSPRPTAADISARVDELHALGIRTLIVAYVEYKYPLHWPAFYPTTIPALQPEPHCMDAAPIDIVTPVMRRAAALGMHVVLGLGRGPALGPTCAVPAPGKDQAGGMRLDDSLLPASDADMDAEAAREREVAADLVRAYGSDPRTRGALYGWYISHEANDYSRALRFYDKVAAALHGLAPEKPVLVAPAGTPINITRAALEQTQVNIFAYQDAVGAGYVGPGASCLEDSPPCPGPYQYSYEPENRMRDLARLFGTYASWHRGTRTHLWSDTEVWQMDGPTYGAAYAATCSRVLRQIAAERASVSQLTMYSFLGYFQSGANKTAMPRPGAAALYDGYSRYARTGRGC
jgi:hypothetical protein